MLLACIASVEKDHVVAARRADPALLLSAPSFVKIVAAVNLPGDEKRFFDLRGSFGEDKLKR